MTVLICMQKTGFIFKVLIPHALKKISVYSPHLPTHHIHTQKTLLRTLQWWKGDGRWGLKGGGGGSTVPWASCHERVEGNGLHWTQFTLEQHLLWPRTVYTDVDMHRHVWPSHWAFFSQHLRFEKKRGHGEHCLHSLHAVVLPDCRHLISAARPKAAHRIQHFADICTHTHAHTHTQSQGYNQHGTFPKLALTPSPLKKDLKQEWLPVF